MRPVRKMGQPWVMYARPPNSRLPGHILVSEENVTVPAISRADLEKNNKVRWGQVKCENETEGDNLESNGKEDECD